MAEIRRRHAGLPVVLLTGSVGSSDVEGVDADGVISKPFTLEQLTGTVGRLVVRNRPEAR
jgi:CheY-like chemotaxis protein